MHKIKVKISWFPRITYLPKSWDQVDPSFLKEIFVTLLSYPEEQARLHILRRLLRMQRKTFAKLTEGQRWDLLNCIDFISLRNLKAQPFRSFARNWTLPSDNFKDGTCFQFAKADHHFKKFKETNDPKELDLFFATLARHKNTSTSCEEDVQFNLKKLQKIPEYIKLVTLCYFAGIKELVYDLYGPFLFDSGLDSDSSGSTYVPKLQLEWWGAYNSVAESGVFGDIKAVHAYNFHDVCTYLVQKKEQYLMSKATPNEQ